MIYKKIVINITLYNHFNFNMSYNITYNVPSYAQYITQQELSYTLGEINTNDFFNSLTFIIEDSRYAGPGNTANNNSTIRMINSLNNNLQELQATITENTYYNLNSTQREILHNTMMIMRTTIRCMREKHRDKTEDLKYENRISEYIQQIQQNGNPFIFDEINISTNINKTIEDNYTNRHNNFTTLDIYNSSNFGELLRSEDDDNSHTKDISDEDINGIDFNVVETREIQQHNTTIDSRQNTRSEHIGLINIFDSDRLDEILPLNRLTNITIRNETRDVEEDNDFDFEEITILKNKK